MATIDRKDSGTEGAQFCPECGHPTGGANFCPGCGHNMGFAADRTLAHPAVQASPGGRRSRVGLIIACAALGVAAVAVAAVILLNGGSGSSPVRPTSSYKQQLTRALAPLISANRTLSSALTSLDGSRATISAAKTDTAQASAAEDAAHGAVAVLAAPSSQSALSGQVQQALTADGGYLQEVSSTLASPSGPGTGQLQTLATGAQSALDPLATVAPGAGTSVSLGNLTSWAQGATGQAKDHQNSTTSQSSTTAQATSTSAQSPPPLSGSCDQGVSVNSVTSCAFADIVFAQYASAIQGSGGPFSTVVTATSPVTGTTYSDSCQYTASTGIVSCSHGSDMIQFSASAAEDNG